MNKSTPVGFEPTRGDPIGLAGRRLSHSAKVSLATTSLRDLHIACAEPRSASKQAKRREGPAPKPNQPQNDKQNEKEPQKFAQAAWPARVGLRSRAGRARAAKPARQAPPKSSTRATTTVAILAQGTHRAVATPQALLPCTLSSSWFLTIRRLGNQTKRQRHR